MRIFKKAKEKVLYKKKEGVSRGHVYVETFSIVYRDWTG